MTNLINKSILAAISFLFVVAFSPVASAADNPFGMSGELTQHMQVAEGKCGGDKKAKCGEGKCGDGKAKKEGKCGEGKCGDGKAKMKGKCGEGKCGDGKDKKKSKCGEGKCGGA